MAQSKNKMNKPKKTLKEKRLEKHQKHVAQHGHNVEGDK